MPAPYGDGLYASEPPSGQGLSIKDVFHLVIPKADDPGNDSRVDSQYPNVAIITPDSLSNRFGGMWAKEKLDLTLPFSTEMYLHLGHRHGLSGTVADGMTFTLHNDPAGIDAIGGAGEGLGVYKGRKMLLGNPVPHGTYLRNSLVIEFDTYRNAREDGGYIDDPGPDNNAHCALMIPRNDVMLSSDHKNVNYFTVTQTWVPFAATWTPNSTGGGRLDYTFNNHTESYEVNDILATFGDTKVYWGFTGATGQYTSVQAAAITSLPEQGASAEKTVTDESGNHIDQGTAYAGDTIHYAIRVISQASQGAIGPIIIADTLSAYVTYTPGLIKVTTGTGEEFNVTGSVSGNLIMVNVDRILAAKNDWLEITFPVTVNADAMRTVVYNTATVEIAGVSAEIITNTTAVTILEAGDPEKKVSDSSEAGRDSSAVKVGDEITYDITYTNFNAASAALIITDQLPDGVNFVSATGGGTYDVPTHTAVWNLPDVPAGETGTVSLVVRVNSQAEVVLANSAIVIVGENKPRFTNIVKNPVIPKDPEKKVSDISEAGQNGSVIQSGDFITYDISYLNYREETAALLIQDQLPIGVDFVSATDGGAYDTGSRTVTWSLSDVPSGENGIVSVIVRVNEKAVVRIDNQATVQVGDDIPLVSSTTSNPVALKAPEKKVADSSAAGINGTPVNIGDQITYEITYQNNQATPATIVITDQLSDGIDFITATDGGSHDDATNTLTWTLPAVPSGESGTVSVVVRVNARAVGIIANTAMIWIDDYGPVPTNTVENPVVPGGPAKKVSATSAAGQNGGAVQKGDEVTYNITYQNYTAATANVTITDRLPIGVDFVSATNGGRYDTASHMVLWNVTQVPSGDGGTVSVVVRVNEKATTRIINYATVQVGGNAPQNTNSVENPLKGSRCADQIKSNKCRKVIKGQKIWVDNDNSGNTRPPSVEIILTRNGQVYRSVSLSSTGSGVYAFGCLPVWKTPHEKYNYQVDEVLVPEHYIKTIDGNNIINTL